MKKLFVLVLIIFLVFTLRFASGIRINEISPRTPEYVEVYNDGEINLDEWRIKDASSNNPDIITCYHIDDCSLITNSKYFLILGRNTNISQITSEDVVYYYVDDAEIGNGLSDAGDNITFFNNYSSSSFFYSSSIKNKSWQYCDGDWKSEDLSPGKDNICSEGNPENNQDTGKNNQESNQNDNTENIIINLDFPDKVYAGEEFDANLELKNLGNEWYDVKIEVYSSQTLSRIFDDLQEKWISGSNYVINAFEQDGKKDFRVNITKDFEGTSILSVKIRKTGHSDVLASKNYNLIVDRKAISQDISDNKEKQNKTEIKTSKNQKIENVKESNENIEVVTLSPKNQDKKEYDSKIETIKNISLVSFLIFCSILMIFILIKMLR